MTYLDIFRLGYILSHGISWKIVFIDPFLTIAPILYPLKTSGNHKSSDFFRGYKMSCKFSYQDPFLCVYLWKKVYMLIYTYVFHANIFLSFMILQQN